MIKFLASIGAAFFGFLGATGRVAIFAGTTLTTAFSPPFYPRALLRQMVDIGYFSLPVVGLTAIFTGMVLALQSYTGFSRFAAEGAVATVVVLSVTRELGPVIAGLMVAGRVGAAMAAEIGTMRVTDQIDALTTLSTNPLRYLVLPRLIAGLVTLPLLVVVADIIGVFGGYLVAVYKFGFNPAGLSRPHAAISRARRCRLRPGQGGRVRLPRRADGLLSRLLFARRGARCRPGDDRRRGLGLDPDPVLRLRDHPGACLPDELPRPPTEMTAAAAPKIAVRGLRKSFGRNRVLDGIDLDCAPGESLVVIGGSGTGKSVLIKCILGLLRPDAGIGRDRRRRDRAPAAAPRASACCRNSACCFRAARCSTRCWCGRMSRSG